MNELASIDNQTIENKIYTIRDMQVMLDRDLAELYGVKPTRLREQVRRNDKKFPSDFMFELTDSEVDFMVSQNAIPSKQHLGGSFPLVFTEQGVSMLATVLRSDIAIEVSIKIIRIFVQIRKLISSNTNMFSRFERVEQRLSLHDEKFDQLFNAIEDKNKKPTQGIFHNGQIYDAYAFINDLLKQAKKEIKNFHDRFLIIDNSEIYHIGASLKDLGNKVFAFSKLNIDISSFEFLGKLR